MKKVKVPVYINDDIVNEIVRHVKGYRGLSSKKSRIRNKKICQVIPDIIEKYILDKSAEILLEYKNENKSN